MNKSEDNQPDNDFRDIAEKIAQDELNDFLISCEMFNSLMKGTVLFNEINMDSITNDILCEVHSTHFDDEDNLKKSSVKKFKDKYANCIANDPEMEDE